MKDGPPLVGAPTTMPTPTPTTRQRPRPRRNAGAALLASSLYTVSTYPLHRVKTLMMTQDANPAILSGARGRFSFFSAFGRLLHEHGGRPTGLWHGATPYLARHVPSVSISFAAKDHFRAALLPFAAGGGGRADATPAPARLLAANAAAGGAAGALALAVVYPFELLTIRMAADMGGGGIGGGGGAGGRHGGAAAAAAMAAGGRAAAATTTTTTAAATTTPSTATIPGAAAPPARAAAATSAYQFGRSPMDAAREVVAADGFRKGLYRGFGPAVASAACYKALYFGLHDSAKQYAYGGKYADAVGLGRDDGLDASESDQDANVDAADAPPARAAAPAAAPWRLGRDPPLALVRTVLERLSIASGTTVIAAALTHPLDVIRKRLVVDSSGSLYGGSVAGVCAGIWRREGMAGFFRFLPQDVFLRSGAGLILVSYDMFAGN